MPVLFGLVPVYNCGALVMVVVVVVVIAVVVDRDLVMCRCGNRDGGWGLFRGVIENVGIAFCMVLNNPHDDMGVALPSTMVCWRCCCGRLENKPNPQLVDYAPTAHVIPFS